jgi:hypothetical protein
MLGGEARYGENTGGLEEQSCKVEVVVGARADKSRWQREIIESTTRQARARAEGSTSHRCARKAWLRLAGEPASVKVVT